MKHVMKAINDTMSNIKYENKVLRESNQKLSEEVNRLNIEIKKLKGEPILNK